MSKWFSSGLDDLKAQLVEQAERFGVSKDEVRSVIFGTTGIHPLLAFFGPLTYLMKSRVLMFTDSDVLIFETPASPNKLIRLLARVPITSITVGRSLPLYFKLNVSGHKIVVHQKFRADVENARN